MSCNVDCYQNLTNRYHLRKWHLMNEVYLNFRGKMPVVKNHYQLIKSMIILYFGVKMIRTVHTSAMYVEFE